MSSPVSAEYIQQYQAIHRNTRYGVSGYKFVPHIQLCVLELRPSVVLDYGCGQTDMTEAVKPFGVQLHRYDPAIPALATLPVSKADLVVNTDVLEHIPEDGIEPYLRHIASLTTHALFSISTTLAQEILPNGQNAHCSVKEPAEWLRIIRRHFPESELLDTSRRHTALILTWPSKARPLIELVDHHYVLRRRAEKLSIKRILRRLIGKK